MPDVNKKKDRKMETTIRKIKKMYSNYGINTDDMAEEELTRLYNTYMQPDKDLDKDLKESEKFLNIFSDDILG